MADQSLFGICNVANDTTLSYWTAPKVQILDVHAYKSNLTALEKINLIFLNWYENYSVLYLHATTENISV